MLEIARKICSVEFIKKPCTSILKRMPDLKKQNEDFMRERGTVKGNDC